MTEETKIQLLKYFVGKYKIEKNDNVPIFKKFKSLKTNLFKYVEEEIQKEEGPLEYASPYIYKTLQIKNSNNNIDKIILIIRYNSKDDLRKNVLVILNNNFVPTQAIFKFSSGEPLKLFMDLNLDNDGNIYGIDAECVKGPQISNLLTNFRFITLNFRLDSIDIKNYSVVIKYSYYIKKLNGSESSTIDRIIKNPNSSEYLIIGALNESNTANYRIFIGSLKINVGSENICDLYYYNSLYRADMHITDYIVNWNSEDSKVKVVTTEYDPSIAFKENIIGIYNFDGEKISLLNTKKCYDFMGIYSYYGDAKFLNDDNIYILLNYISDFSISTGEISYTGEQGFAILKWNFNNENIETIHKNEIADSEESNTGMFASFYKDEYNNIFFQYYFKYNLEENFKYEIYIGKIENEIAHYYNFKTTSSLFEKAPFFFVLNLYNLYNIYFQIGEDLFIIQLIYNNFNYNGIPYSALNSMVPNSSIFYDQEENIIFARNLYNKSIVNNVTTSSVEIPNTILNDCEIFRQDLIGETNQILIQNNNAIQKNIYENVIVNFINSLIIKNSNDPLHAVINIEGSSVLNNSISNIKNYDDVKAIKYKINYSDDSSIIKSFNSKQIILDNYTATYEIMIYIPYNKKINNIQIISNDEQTIYQTIDTSLLENNKFFLINQSVEII